jgi:hypothetical protein
MLFSRSILILPLLNYLLTMNHISTISNTQDNVQQLQQAAISEIEKLQQAAWYVRLP